MRGKWSILLGLLVIPALLFGSCSGIGDALDEAAGALSEITEALPDSGTAATTVAASPRQVTGTIDAGAPVTVLDQSVGVAGGTVRVNGADNPLDGMVIGVPANSYPEAREFKISCAPVEQHTFGAAFNPVTPLIGIDNGGGYAAELVEVKIPVAVPEDHFAMGFIYDKASGTLEGLPTLAQDAASITVGTRHFSWLVVSIISDALLKADIESGFRPGIDDWQFVNRGSYIAPGGHCAGQTVTALWYYMTQPDGGGLTLNGRYDNNGQKPATPGIWPDDSYGYRFASVIQKDINWESLENRLMMKTVGLNDEVTWKSFAYAMQLNRAPQFVGIKSNAGGGHAMVVYRVANGTLYIADPNYPGNLDRRIAYSGGAFTPYNSGANEEEIAAGNGKAYENIGYVQKTAIINWDTIASRWQEFKAGTIGNNIFPKEKLTYFNAQINDYSELPDNLNFPQKKISIFAWLGNNGALSTIYRDGKVISPQAEAHYLDLQPGKNVLGVYVAAKAANGKIRYVNFRNITINYGGGVAIDPAEMTGKPDTDYTFTAVAGTGMDAVSYNWEINGRSVQSGADDTLTTRFASAGTYTVAVSVIDDKTRAEMASATAQAVIVAATTTPAATSSTAINRLPMLQGQKYFRGAINAGFTYDKWEPATGNSTATSTFIAITITNTSGSIPITWNGTSFSGSGTSGDNTYTLSGTVSADGTMLNSLEFNKEYLYRGADFTTRATTRIVLAGPIPILSPGGLPNNVIRGEEVAKYVSAVSYSEVTTDNQSGQETKTIVYRSADWSPDKSAMTLAFTNEP